MDKYLDGYHRFRATRWREYREMFERLGLQGQAPQAMVITCSDSRIDPQMIFGVAPGELFVVRNVANLVPPYAPNADYHGTSAAVEFGVRFLKVSHVIVLGHARCGGVGALMGGRAADTTDFVMPWMQIAAPARARAQALGGDPDTIQRHCEHETVKVSLDNLLTFPWVAERVARGDLTLHGCFFDILVGTLWRLDEAGRFNPA